MAERQMAEWTYGQKPYDRKDVWPKGQKNGKKGPNGRVTERHLTGKTYGWRTNGRKY